jgi:hypothetical protein
MSVSRMIDEEIRSHQQVIARLKREIFGVDKTNRSRYIKEFLSEFRRFKRICSASEVVEAAARSDIVYFGDYHPLDSSQEWVLRLMRELSARGRSVVLALEMLYIQQQQALDRWMKGAISEQEFLDAIEYQTEWGFNWKSFKRIFKLAKNPFIPIFGIDAEPRDHLRSIGKRDRLAAQRIGTIRSFFPNHTMLVVIGESHLASSHLPAEVHRVFGKRLRETVIVQNIDDIYWQLLRRGKEDAEAVAIDRSRYCIFTTSPMLKYEAYRDTIDRWMDGDIEDRTTHMVHEMIDGIFLFLKVIKGSLRVTIRPEWRVPLEAVYPEVHCRKTYHAISAYLRRRRASPAVSSATLETIKSFDMAYIPELNTFLVLRFNATAAAREAARFVLAVMRDSLGEGRTRRKSRRDAFYDAVIDEALACFGSKIVNPTQDCLKGDLLMQALDARGEVRGTVHRRTPAETREAARFFKASIEREHPMRTLRGVVDEDRLPALGARKRVMLERALGNRLGEAMYHAFHAGKFKRRDIVELFRGADRERPAEERYRSLLERSGVLGRSPFATGATPSFFV